MLDKFERLDNHFTKSQIDNILASIKQSGKISSDARVLIAQARSALSSKKYSTANISKLNQGYVEFRIAGNKDYHLKDETIRQTVLRFVSCLEIACNPDLYRKEYLSKVGKLFLSAEPEKKDFSKYSVTDFLDEHGYSALVKSFDDWLQDLKARKPYDQKRLNLSAGRIIGTLVSVANELKIDLPNKCIREVLEFLKLGNIKIDDIKATVKEVSGLPEPFKAFKGYLKA